MFRNNDNSLGQTYFYSTFIKEFFLIKDPIHAQSYGLYHTYRCPIASLRILPNRKSRVILIRRLQESMFPYLLIQLPNLWPIAVQQPSNDVLHQPTNQGAVPLLLTLYLVLP